MRYILQQSIFLGILGALLFIVIWVATNGTGLSVSSYKFLILVNIVPLVSFLLAGLGIIKVKNKSLIGFKDYFLVFTLSLLIAILLISIPGLYLLSQFSLLL